MPATEKAREWRFDDADEDASRSAIRKVVWRLVPIFLLCNFANYLDRTNVSFAALTMNRDMGFDATTFGIGAGIFSLGYFVFQIPSSIMSEKMGARFWISIMMMTWGIISALNGVIWDETSFFVIRFLLGAAEAGFAPAMIVYMTWWVPKPQRARMLALGGTASILSALIGSPLSGWVLDTFHMVHGLAGWRWLFLIEICSRAHHGARRRARAEVAPGSSDLADRAGAAVADAHDRRGARRQRSGWPL